MTQRSSEERVLSSTVMFGKGRPTKSSSKQSSTHVSGGAEGGAPFFCLMDGRRKMERGCKYFYFERLFRRIFGRRSDFSFVGPASSVQSIV